MNNRIVKNASWIIACKVARAVLNLVVSMITARYLGPSNYGLITYVSSIVAFIVPLVQLGINCILVQEFVDNPFQSGRTIGTATLLTTVSSFLGILGTWAFVSIVNRNETETIVVSVLYSVSLFFQMTEMIQYWYQSKLLSKYVSIVSLISRIVVSLYKICIIISGKNLYWFAIVNSLDFLIISIALFVIYFKLEGQRLSFSMDTARKMLSKSKHFIIAGMMVSVFTQTDKIMIKLMVGDAESGYYSAAATCVGMSVFVFTAIIDSFRPVIFENKKTNQSLYKTNTIRLYAIVIYMALAQSVVLTVFARPIINLLYGSEYLSAVGILQIITWYSAFSYLGAARNIWFLAEKKQKYVWITNLIGATVNVIGNAALIPLWGAYGAAISSVVTQFIINFALSFVIKPIRENGMWMVYALNPKALYQMLVRKSR